MNVWPVQALREVSRENDMTMAKIDRNRTKPRDPTPPASDALPRAPDQPSTKRHPEQPDPLDEEILDRVVRECPL